MSRHQTQNPSCEASASPRGTRHQGISLQQSLPVTSTHINHRLCIQLVLKGMKLFLHLEISTKLISKPLAFNQMPPEGLERGYLVGFFLSLVVRLTLNAKLLLILPVHKRISQILETTVYLAGDRCLQVSKGRHHLPSSLNAHSCGH